MDLHIPLPFLFAASEDAGPKDLKKSFDDIDRKLKNLHEELASHNNVRASKGKPINQASSSVSSLTLCNACLLLCLLSFGKETQHQ